MTPHGDRYLRVLCVLLLGYALMGKGFAYIGVAPFYVGELTMVWGVLVLFCSENWSRVLRTAWFWPLLALMLWGAIRTVPFLATYGTDALHDAAIWIWGTFAIVLASLLAAEPRRLAYLEKKFRSFAVLLLILGPISYCISIFADAFLPNAPWADVPYVLVKGGDLVVHLCGIFAFFVLLGGPQMAFVVPMMIVNLVLYFTGRASMVTFASCSAIATALRPQSTLPWRLFPALVIGVTLLWLLNVHIETKIHDPGRIVSADQIIENVQSIFSDSNNENLDGSREWRLLWWDTITDYTLHGHYFWKGKGFGINLADDDGFQVEADHSLRNPHNGHLTMLARGGVPMLVLWAICQFTLGYGLVCAAWSARRRGDRHWFGFLAFLFIYWLAFLINASFDVFLEGPVGGIWFWCVYGTGIGAVWIYRNCPEALHEAPIAGAEGLPAELLGVQRKTRALELCAS
ncbi:MAG: O-antigen ligase family protein [Tepidisphaeraceae bacterium]|jgi:hypothetical protein